MPFERIDGRLSDHLSNCYCFSSDAWHSTRRSETTRHRRNNRAIRKWQPFHHSLFIHPRCLVASFLFCFFPFYLFLFSYFFFGFRCDPGSFIHYRPWPDRGGDGDGRRNHVSYGRHPAIKTNSCRGVSNRSDRTVWPSSDSPSPPRRQGPGKRRPRRVIRRRLPRRVRPNSTATVDVSVFPIARLVRSRCSE